MITQLSQDSITEYASDARTIDEPLGTDYSQGVRVGRTVPAKWWNWLFSAVTKRVGQSKTDAQNMLTELQNVVTDAGISLDPTDSTQVSQAIDAKADAQIADYVEAKKGFMTSWGTLAFPATLTSKGFTAFDGIFQVNGLVVGVVRGDSKIGVAVSYDLRNWVVVKDMSTSSGSNYVPGTECVYFNGAYYLFISIYALSSYTGVYRSVDGLVWNQIHQQSGSIYTNGFLFGVMNGALYMSYGSAYLTSKAVYKLASDGLSFSTTTMEIDSNSSGGVNRVGRSTPIFAMDSPGKYIVGNCIIDTTNDTLAALTTPQTSQYYFAYGLSSASMIVSGIDMLIGTRVRHLQNGGYLLYEFSSGGDRYRYTILDSEGTLVSQAVYTSGTGPGFDTSCIPFDAPTYTLKRQSSPAQFSGDGENFLDLPFSGYLESMCYNDGVYYLEVYSGVSTTPAKIYSIEGALSEDLADYTLLSELPGTVGGNICYGGAPGVFMAGDFGYYYQFKYVSLDNCATWKVVTTIDEATSGPACRPIAATYNEDVYSLVGDSIYYSSNEVNRVIGHTLYLA